MEIYRSDDQQKQGELLEINPPIDWAFRRQAEHFVACVRDGTEPRSGGRDALEDMRLMEEIFRKMTLV